MITEELKNLINSDAKNVVDLLFETRVLDSKITRDQMNTLEEYIGSIIQGRVSNYVNLISLKSKIDETF
jgi:ribosome-interacting GTPase 1